MTVQLEAQEKAFKAMERKHTAVLQNQAFYVAIAAQQQVSYQHQIDWSLVDSTVKTVIEKNGKTVINANRALDNLQWSGFSKTERFKRILDKHTIAYHSLVCGIDGAKKYVA